MTGPTPRTSPVDRPTPDRRTSPADRPTPPGCTPSTHHASPADRPAPDRRTPPTHRTTSAHRNSSTDHTSPADRAAPLDRTTSTHHASPADCPTPDRRTPPTPRTPPAPSRDRQGAGGSTPHPSRPSEAGKSRLTPLAAYAVFAYAFLHVPLLILAVFSFNGSRFTLWQGFSLHWYSSLLQDSELLESAANSLIIAAVSTVVATALGTLAAYGLWKRASSWISGSLYLSLVTPEIVAGVSLLAFFQWTFRFLHLRLGMHTVILAHVGFSLAYVVVVVLARLRSFDPALEEAALDLGATEFTAFRKVTVPYLAPAIAAAAMLAFTVSIDDYVITSLVAGVDSQTLPMVIYALARRGVNPMLNAVSTIIVVALGAMVLISERLRSS